MRTSLAALTALAAFAGLALAAQPSNKPQGNSRAASPEARTTSNTAARPDNAQPDNAQPTGDILYLYSSGLAEMLASRKDHGLRDALALIQPRLIELAEMSGDMPEPEKTINTLWTLAASPLSLRIAATEPGEDGAPPFAIELQSRPEDADALERSIVSLMRSGEVDLRTTETGREFDTPMGPARFGLIENDAALSLALGQPLPATQHTWDIPDGYTPIFALHANLRNVQPLIEMALSQAPDAEEARPMLEQAGIVGDDALILDLAVAHDEFESIIRGTLHDFRPHAAAMGLPENVTLDRDFLALIPADATYVTAGVFDLDSLEQVLALPEAQEGLEQINAQLGIDVVEDIINQIGNRFAMYQSDTTGGGGMLSMVAVLELESGQRFARAHRRLVDAANDFAAEQAQEMTDGFGGVEIRARRADGVEFFTLTFPGLPIPAEISWTIHGDHLIAALSPRSLVQAMAQTSGDHGSFADNPMLAHVSGQDDADDTQLITVSYTDAPRFAVQGYSLVSVLCASISNALRTQDGPDPGIPLPAFNDFIDGIQPNMTLSYWDGDDLKIRGRADASLLVNLAGTSGAAMGPMAIGAAAAALIPALGEARASAVQLKASSQLRQLTMAMFTYAADHADKLPESIDDLMPYLGDDQSLLASPLGPCYDGTPDFAIRTDLGGTAIGRIASPTVTLAAIDRASLINGADMVIVGFMDGHVESIFSWQLTDLLAQEHNRGAYEAFNLPDWLNPGF